MKGIDRLREAFARDATIKLMTHAVVGYPDIATSARILRAMADSGADFIEAQLPFSDPIADGPSIVEANHVALRAGSRTLACLETLARLRSETDIPILVMSYLNPLLAHGIEAIVGRIADAGLDGLIVPDWPDDEPELALGEKCAAAGLALVPLIAPSTSLDRAEALARASSSPFVYAVTRLGVTGRRTQLETSALERLSKLRDKTGDYVAAGFGIRERAQVELLAGYADCAIVGSALVDAARAAHHASLHPALHAGASAASGLATGVSAAGSPAASGSEGIDPAEAVAALVRSLAGRA
jgi:tryptophan synthase alpha chain